MKFEVYSIYDSAVEEYSNPYYARTDQDAMRSFKQVVNDPQSMISKAPSDYTLFKVGQFDTKQGSFETHPPVSLGNAITFVDIPLFSKEDLNGKSISNEAPVQQSSTSGNSA